jgi:hypothetical protein
MSAYSQFHKIISVLLIFIMMAELPGCVSSVKFIQIQNLPLQDNNPSNSYIVRGLRSGHFPKWKTFVVKNISISDGYLTAESYQGTNRTWTYFTIYVASDSLIKVAPDRSVRIDLNDIYKVQVEEFNWVRFWAYTAAGVLVFSVLIVLILGDPHSGDQI